MPQVGSGESAVRRKIGERLKEAIEFRRLSIREFQRRLATECKKRGIAGASYAQIHNYLSGRREPSLALLGVVVDVLDVRQPWLALGEGQLVGEDVEDVEDPLLAALESAVPGFKDWRPGIHILFIDTVIRWYQTAPDRKAEKVGYQFLVGLATELADALLAPAEYWGTTGRVTDEYLISALLAFRLLLAEPGAGQPVGEYKRILTIETIPEPVSEEASQRKSRKRS